MLHCLPGKLVRGQVIFFSVAHGRGTVGMRGEFVELSGSLVRIIWHSIPSSTIILRLESFGFPEAFESVGRS
jgi:hypothetical protein